MTNKERYKVFCQTTYIPIYSKSWWMDAVCGEDNWDVWLYESGGTILAAMPYYFEQRGAYRYITKAPLTQNNGIIFKEDPQRKLVAEAQLQEKIINEACRFIDEKQVDVYEQQFQTSFTNWLPFYWNNYTNIVRYTYIIEDTSDMSIVWDNISSKLRNEIRKGQKNIKSIESLPADEFYYQHEKVYSRQGLKCPFSYDLWQRLYCACVSHDACEIMCAKGEGDEIYALLFLVWDERSVYHIMGGYMQEFSSSQAYPALIYNGIELAHNKGLKYDFEGSVIKRISTSFRQYGGVPTPYFRIRKVFNPEIVRKEAEDYIRRVQNSCE